MLPLSGIARDARHAMRTLAAAPGFTAIAVATLALGIGANTAIFSICNALLLRPLPYGQPGRLVMIWETDPRQGDSIMPVAPANYRDWKQRSGLFEDIGISRDVVYALSGDSREPESVFGYRFSENFFRVMGVAPALGRTFTPEEDRPGGPPVVVLSHVLWQRRYDGDPGVIGRGIVLSGTSFTVIGVMPPGFDHPGETLLWTPLALRPDHAERRDARFLRLVARMKPGVSIDRAQEDLGSIARALEIEHPETNAGRGVRVVSLRDMQVGDIRPALLALLGSVGFVLLMCVTNVSNMLLARAGGRSRELAIRMALGASRGRIVRLLLTESALIALAGGGLGLLLALWGAGAMLAMIPRGIANLGIPQIDRIPVDLKVLGFTLLVALASGLLLGVLPALRATRRAAADSLRESGSTLTPGRKSRRMGALLVAGQTAIAVVLLVGAALMLQTFLTLRAQPLGMNPSRVMAAQVILPAHKYPDAQKRWDFLDAVLQRLSHMQETQAAGATNYLPLTGFWGTVSFTVEGQAPPRPGQEPEADNRLVTPGYFESLDIPLIRGRLFARSDTGASPQVAIVNATLARRLWGEADPIGARLNLGDSQQPSLWEVVGVVGDVRAFGAGTEIHAEIYRPFTQASSPLMAFTVRTIDPPAAMASRMKEAIREVDADQPATIEPLESLASASLATRRVSAQMIGLFGALALVMAAIGIYGVMSHTVARRTQEMGMRMALGAVRRDLLFMVMRQGLWPPLAGLAAGLGGAFALTRWLGSLLYGVSPADPTVYGGVCLVLTAVAALACYLPARRAVAVDPMTALRSP